VATQNTQTPDWESVLQLAKQEDLLDDPAIQKLVQLATVTENEYLKQRIKKLVAAKAAHCQTHPFDEDPSPDTSVDDRLSLGVTRTGNHVVLNPADLSQHLLAVGQSGAGKTTFFYNLMDQLTVPFWAFDLKQDYRHLVQEESHDLLVLPWAELKFNPLRPPVGVSPRRWAQVFSEIFGHATSLLSGSKNYLMKQIIELYKTYNLFDDVAEPFPSLHELQLWIRRDKINYVRKQSNYRDTVLNRLESMNLTAGTIFACSQGYTVNSLVGRDVVFEFDGLGRDLQNFLMEILFASVYEFRLAQNQRGGGLRHVFFLDEGKRVFSVYKERQDAAGIPAIDEFTAKMREFGEGLVVADQEATKLTESIKANTYTKLLLPTGDFRQFREMMQSMDLTDRQAAVAQGLETGEAVIRRGNNEPVAAELANFKVEKEISDAELRSVQGQFWNELTHEPPETTWEFRHELGIEQDVSVEVPDDSEDDVDLSEDAEQLLEDVVENPFKALSKRYECLPSTRRGYEAKSELLDAGLVEERSVQNKTKNLTLLEFTDRGREYLKENDVPVTQEGRGGVVHRYWQHRIKDVIENVGWTAKLEMTDADVYVNMHGVELVIEVAMGNNQREVDHVEKHLAKKFDVVWVACRTKEIRDGLQERLEENDIQDDRVKFLLFPDILDMETPFFE